jgi:hypothetical protein
VLFPGPDRRENPCPLDVHAGDQDQIAPLPVRLAALPGPQVDQRDLPLPGEKNRKSAQSQRGQDSLLAEHPATLANDQNV